MKMAKWMVDKGLRQSDLAKKMGVSQVTIHNWVYAKRPPSGIHMMELYRLSGGKVGLKDWCEEFDK